ncbi:hypothetical protein ZWY2020_034206 [Hordeum vulgare]|nr:hypothetical protein ZWY2020_034206 [Hordeum vulgare]
MHSIGGWTCHASPRAACARSNHGLARTHQHAARAPAARPRRHAVSARHHAPGGLLPMRAHDGMLRPRAGDGLRSPSCHPRPSRAPAAPRARLCAPSRAPLPPVLATASASGVEHEGQRTQGQKLQWLQVGPSGESGRDQSGCIRTNEVFD